MMLNNVWHLIKNTNHMSKEEKKTHRGKPTIEINPELTQMLKLRQFIKTYVQKGGDIRM